MNEGDPIVECAQLLQRKGLGTAAIFILEASKPCIGLFREGVVAAAPILSCMLGQSKALEMIQSIRTSDDAEKLIRLLEQRGTPI